MRVLLVFTLMWVCGFLPSLSAEGRDTKQKKKFWTYPMPAKIIPTSPLKVEMAFQIAEPLEAYKFKVVENNPKKPSGKVRLYQFDYRGRRILSGELSVGEKISVEGFRRFANEHYYMIKNNDQQVWIAGKSIGIDGFIPVER